MVLCNGESKKECLNIHRNRDFYICPYQDSNRGPLGEHLSDWNLLSRPHNIDSIKIFFSKTLKYFIVRPLLVKTILYKSKSVRIKSYSSDERRAYFALLDLAVLYKNSLKTELYFVTSVENMGKTLLRPRFRHLFLESP